MIRIATSIATLLLPGFATAQHPVPASDQWLNYSGKKDLPGNGKLVVLVAAEQEYRSEQGMPMLAKVLSTHHGFDCTVLFAQRDGKVDPTQSTPPSKDDENVKHHDIPGLEHLAKADLLILFNRFMTLPEAQLGHLISYFDSGKPLLGIRTANHGFSGKFPYKIDGKKVRFGDDILGGSFRGHHGGWHREATRGIIVDKNKDHPILRGVTDVFGPSDVYRMYGKDKSLPERCTPLLLGQPLTGLGHDDPPNKKKEALPIAWATTWTTSTKQTARVFHVTMGSARDYQSAGLRRLTCNAAYWCTDIADKIDTNSSVAIVGDYQPLKSGFNYEKLGVIPRPVSHYK